MLLIDSKFVDSANNAKKASDLYELLQKAIELEHATIPPYLTAAYSLRRGTNNGVRNLILNVAEEEMLHMTIAANVLNAIGGRPRIDHPDFMPTYPGPLPMAIGGGFEVGIKKFSLELVRDVFMKIEQPENPIITPEVNVPFSHIRSQQFSTIGAFYNAIIEKIEKLGDGVFTGNPDDQVILNPNFKTEHNFKITNVETAVHGLSWIVSDGEGTSSSPLDTKGDPAHYYKFEAIVNGRDLMGNPVLVELNEIFDFPDNPKEVNYEEGSPELELVHSLNVLYSRILRHLNGAFNGEPARAREAVSLMGEFRLLITEVLETQDPTTGKQCGPTFEYVP